MEGECLVIALIIFVLGIGFFRAKRKNWGFAVLPLGLVPFAVGVVMSVFTYFVKKQPPFAVPAGLIVGALIIACVWIGISSTILIKTKKLRVSYLITSVGFEFALSFILLVRYYLEFNPQ